MYRYMLMCFFLVTSAINAQNINLRGKILNQAGQPIANATVTLVKQGLMFTTGADGAYSIISTPVVSPVPLIPQTQSIIVERGCLEYSLPSPSPMKIEFFNINGRLLKKVMIPNASRGFYYFNVDKNFNTQLLVIRTSIGQDEFTFRYLPFKGTCLVNQSDESTSSTGTLAKIAVIDDTLKVTAAKYSTKVKAITTYDQQLNITLDTAGTVGPSAGCGKTPTLTSGKRSIQNRSFIMRIPENYDKNRPYRLIFAYHWNGGTSEDVDGGGTSGYTWSYYGLREQANNSTIFVAPQGLSNGWGNGNNSDVIFTDNMLNLIKNDLCVDTMRIFAMGFSYGGGMTKALGCQRPKVFRAIAVYAGAEFLSGGCDNTSTSPMAYIGFHSINDNTCGYAGGEAIRDRFVKNNGCTPQTAARPVGMNHVITTYQGCKEGYPVKWCAFDGGGHTPAPVDGSTSGSGGGDKTWTKKEAWNFFSQF